MILKSKGNIFADFDINSLTTSRDLLKMLGKRNQFKEELKQLFSIDEKKLEVIRIGNAKSLIEAINELDNECDKIDLEANFKDVYLDKILEGEKAIFQIFNLPIEISRVVDNKDSLFVETRYDAKADLLDYYHFSKFANFLKNNDFDVLISTIRDYIVENYPIDSNLKLRILYSFEKKKYYLRAITSTEYRDFGINFSVFVALMTLDSYVKSSSNEIFINSFRVDDSTLYVSFELKNDLVINNDLRLTLNLILENDELKRNAVSFNGVFKLKYTNKNKVSEIYLKPKGLKREGKAEPVDLLTFQHRGSVENVLDKIKELDMLISSFVKQVTEDAISISKINHPDDIRIHLSNKIKFARKSEFLIYKERIYKKLMSMTVDTTFQLFELLREVDELFEHTDILSRDFWRMKLYDTLTNREPIR